jgi:anaerobic magnesium-protoporphyrin IX monomethyl ester cyclase
MPDLLLTHGYFMKEDEKELQIRKPYPPLGLLYICSHLRAAGHTVEVFDSTFASKQELFTALVTIPPTVLGVYANLMTRRNVIEIVQYARRAGWKVVVGGPEPGAYDREFLAAGADVVVRGEGERTMAELLEVFARGSQKDLANVSGISYFDEEGQLVTTAPRAQIEDLDAQPWPARDAIDVSRYVQTWREAHGQGSVSLITARGCPYKCRWCSHQVFGQTHRRRDPILVVDELEWLIQTYSPDMFWVADDVFTIHHGWLRKFAAEMKRRSLRLPFECISRADRMSDEVVGLLAELGCFRVWVGSESGSQKILDSMQRGVTVQQVQQAVDLCRKAGIQAGMFLMWGYEGEELEDIEATIEHVKRSDPDVFLTTVSYPIRGTPYYEEIKSKLVQLKPWQESSDREIVIRGRHSRRFYEYADQLLRDEVALHRASKFGQPMESSLSERIHHARAGLLSTYQEVEA